MYIEVCLKLVADLVQKNNELVYRNSLLIDKLLEKEVLKTTLQGIELKIDSLLQGANKQSCPQVHTTDDELATVLSSLTDYDETFQSSSLQPLYHQPQCSSFEEFSEGFSHNIEPGFSGVCFETDISQLNKLDTTMPPPSQKGVSMAISPSKFKSVHEIIKAKPNLSKIELAMYTYFGLKVLST